jgi:hypothetical protein
VPVRVHAVPLGVPSPRVKTTLYLLLVSSNLVRVSLSPTNSPIMSQYESMIRSALEGGQTVRFRSVPLYEGSELIPHSIVLEAAGSQGFTLSVTIPNAPYIP